MTGPAVASSGWPIAAIRRPSSSNRVAVLCAPPPNVGSRTTEKSAEPKIPSAGPSQATGRVQSRRAPRRAIPASSASSADRTIRTWTGPAAWRNVPQVVATGKSRLVTRKVTPASRTTGRTAAPRACHGRASEADERDRQTRQEQDREEVVGEPVDPHLEEASRADGEVARQGRRVVPGEDVEAGHAEGVGDGLTRERAPEHRPVAEHPRQRRPGSAIAPTTTTSRSMARRARRAASQIESEPDRLVAGQRRQADEDAEGDDARVGRGGRRRSRRRSGSSAGRRPGRAPRTASSNRAGRSGGGAGR